MIDHIFLFLVIDVSFVRKQFYLGFLRKYSFGSIPTQLLLIPFSQSWNYVHTDSSQNVRKKESTIISSLPLKRSRKCQECSNESMYNDCLDRHVCGRHFYYKVSSSGLLRVTLSHLESCALVNWVHLYDFLDNINSTILCSTHIAKNVLNNLDIVPKNIKLFINV